MPAYRLALRHYCCGLANGSPPVVFCFDCLQERGLRLRYSCYSFQCTELCITEHSYKLRDASPLLGVPYQPQFRVRAPSREAAKPAPATGGVSSQDRLPDLLTETCGEAPTVRGCGYSRTQVAMKECGFDHLVLARCHRFLARRSLSSTVMM